jgi:hypothetical protein
MVKKGVHYGINTWLFSRTTCCLDSSMEEWHLIMCRQPETRRFDVRAGKGIFLLGNGLSFSEHHSLNHHFHRPLFELTAMLYRQWKFPTNVDAYVDAVPKISDSVHRQLLLESAPSGVHRPAGIYWSRRA